MALPNTGITTSMVAQAIGVGSNDVGTLCKSNKINKWSKWKPISLAEVTPITIDDLKNSNFGLNIPYFSSLGNINTEDSFLYVLKNKTFSWNYIKPSGGSTSPYRLGDFRNYNHSAVIPIVSSDSYSAFIYNNSISFDLDMSVVYPNDYNICLQDFKIGDVEFIDFYLGVLLYNSNGYMIGTSSSKMNSSTSINLSGIGSNYGNYTAAFFASSVSFGLNDNPSSGYFVPIDIPQVPVTINQAGSGFVVNAIGVWNQSNTQVSYSITITNNDSSQRTLTNVKATLLYTTGSQNPESGTVISTQNIGNVTVPANDYVTTSGGTFSISRVAGRTYWLAGLADGVSTVYTQVEDSEQ